MHEHDALDPPVTLGQGLEVAARHQCLREREIELVVQVVAVVKAFPALHKVRVVAVGLRERQEPVKAHASSGCAYEAARCVHAHRVVLEQVLHDVQERHLQLSFFYFYYFFCSRGKKNVAVEVEEEGKTKKRIDIEKKRKKTNLVDVDAAVWRWKHLVDGLNDDHEDAALADARDVLEREAREQVGRHFVCSFFLVVL